MTKETNASQTAGNGAAEPSTAAAKPGLDSLLKQFETSNATPKAVDALKAFQPVIEFATQEMQSRQETALKTDVANSVKSVKETLKLPENHPDKSVRGYLFDYANEHKDFAEAWDNRSQNPDAWKVQLEKASTAYKSEIVDALPGNSVRTDLEAATAAVRNQTTAPQTADKPDAVTLMNMSDREFAQYKQRLAAQQR